MYVYLSHILKNTLTQPPNNPGTHTLFQSITAYKTATNNPSYQRTMLINYCKYCLEMLLTAYSKTH